MNHAHHHRQHAPACHDDRQHSSAFPPGKAEIIRSTKFSLDEQIRQAILLLEPLWEKKHLNLDVDLTACKFYGTVRCCSRSGSISCKMPSNSPRLAVCFLQTRYHRR